MIPSRMGRSTYLPWRNEGGPSTWPLVLLADRGITLVGSKVSAWTDTVTGNGKSVVQAVDTAQPTWTTGDAKYSGRASLTGGSGIIMTSSTMSIPQPFTLCWYGWGYTANLRIFISSDAVRFHGTGYDSAGRLWMNAGGDQYIAGGPPNDSLCHACVAVFNGANSVFYSDSSAAVSCSPGTNEIAAPVSILSYQPLPTAYYADSIRTVMIKAGALDANAARRVIAWMRRS